MQKYMGLKSKKTEVSKKKMEKTLLEQDLENQGLQEVLSHQADLGSLEAADILPQSFHDFVSQTS